MLHIKVLPSTLHNLVIVFSLGCSLAGFSIYSFKCEFNNESFFQMQVVSYHEERKNKQKLE